RKKRRIVSDTYEGNIRNVGLVETINRAAQSVQRSEVQVSLDDVAAGKLLVNGSAIAVRSISAINEGQVDDANNLPVNAVSFVYGDAKNSPSGNTGTILDVSGLGSGYSIQLFANYSTGEILAFRARNGDNRTWNKWNFVYHTGNKPTPTDVGALPITGGTLRGTLHLLFLDARPNANCMIANDDASGILSCAYGYYQDRFDIHFYDEKGAWASNPLTVGRTGNTTVTGNLSGRAVYEGNIRVYSPNNPPPATDLSAYATRQWVLQNTVQDIDHTAPTEFQFWDGRGYMRPTDGAAMYNFQMVGGSSNVGYIQIRYTRKLVNGTWYVIN
ncbi:phage tail protein, partial [Citrobacter freundii]|nr:phage tail protein [Citrobacter freundii]